MMNLCKSFTLLFLTALALSGCDKIHSNQNLQYSPEVTQLLNDGNLGKDFDPIRYNNYLIASRLDDEHLKIADQHFYFGVANNKDQILIPPAYDKIEKIGDYFAVAKGQDVKYLKLDGTPLTTDYFTQIYPFQDGLAQVQEKPNAQYVTYLNYINTSGQLLLNPGFDSENYNIGNFNEGLALIQSNTNNTINYINTQGKYICSKPLNNAIAGSDFNSGYAMITLSDNKKVYINTQCQIVKTPAFNDLQPFFEGYAAVKSSCGWQYIKAKPGFPLLTQQCFHKAWQFYHGAAVVKNEKGQVNFINTQGKLISKTWYHNLHVFTDGYAWVEQNNQYNFIDKDGNLLSKTWFDNANHFTDGYALVVKNKKYNFMDQKGQIVNSTWFDQATPTSEYNDNQYGIVGDTQFSYVVNKGDNIGLLDQNRKLVDDSWIPNTFNGGFIFFNRVVRAKYFASSSFKVRVLDGQGHKLYPKDLFAPNDDAYPANFGLFQVQRLIKGDPAGNVESNFADSINPKPNQFFSSVWFDELPFFGNFSADKACIVIQKDEASSPEHEDGWSLSNLLINTGETFYPTWQNTLIMPMHNPGDNNPNIIAIGDKNDYQFMNAKVCKLVNDYHFKAYCYPGYGNVIYVQDKHDAWYDLTEATLKPNTDEKARKNAVETCQKVQAADNFGQALYGGIPPNY